MRLHLICQYQGTGEEQTYHSSHIEAFMYTHSYKHFLSCHSPSYLLSSFGNSRTSLRISLSLSPATGPKSVSFLWTLESPVLMADTLQSPLLARQYTYLPARCSNPPQSASETHSHSP